MTDNTNDSRAERERLPFLLSSIADDIEHGPDANTVRAAAALLRADAALREQLAESQREVAALTKDAERHEHALQQIRNWCNAYPISVFPEPDFPRAAKVLKDAGMTIDSISASNMRHVINGVSKILDAALRSEGERVSGAEGSK